jgi:hypothetical protein
MKARNIHEGLAAILAMVVCASSAAAESSLNVDARGTTLSVEDARPVAKGVGLLVAQYALPITYEDPRYKAQDDLEDVTEKVRKDLAKFPPGQAPKVIAPRGGSVKITSSSTDPEVILGELIKAQAALGHGGRFKLEQTGDFLHVVPTSVRDTDGNWKAEAAVLDTPINLAVEDRTAAKLINDICLALSAAAHVKVTPVGSIGGGIDTGREPITYRLESDNQAARTVLVSALNAIAPERGLLTWSMLYQANKDRYFLNLLPVPTAPPEISSSPAAEAPTQSKMEGPSEPKN